MTEITTKKPLQVVATAAGPLLRLTIDQVEAVKRVLDANHVFYWVAEDSLSMNGGPYWTRIHFGHNGNADAIQALLDAAN